jgi:hypothetical protein
MERWNCITLQKKFIMGVLSYIPPQDLEILLNEDKRSRTELENAIRCYKRDNIPTMISERTMRRWMYHYFLYGEIPEETFQWRSKRSKWEDTDTDYLHGILIDHPEYYF